MDKPTIIQQANPIFYNEEAHDTASSFFKFYFL